MRPNALLRLALAPLSAGALITGLSAQTAPAADNAETIAAMEEARRGNLASAATVAQFLDAIHAPD